MSYAVMNSAVSNARTSPASSPYGNAECLERGKNLVADASVERTRNDEQQTIKVLAEGTLAEKATDVMDRILVYAVSLAMMLVAGQALFLSFVRIAGFL